MFFSKRKGFLHAKKPKLLLCFFICFLFSFQLLLSQDFKGENNSDNLKNQLRDHQPKEELERLQNIDKLERANQEVTITKNRQVWLVLVTITVIVLVFILIIILRQFTKSKGAKIQILKLETQLMQTELELLQIKNEAAKNSIQSSKNLQIKIHEIIESIRQSEIAKDPSVIGIRQDLERLISVSFQGKTQVDPIKSDLIIYEQLKLQYPDLSNLNETSVQILLFSLKDATPMFISREMRLNVQYVRNVRSRLKSILNPENSEQWKWADIHAYLSN